MRRLLIALGRRVKGDTVFSIDEDVSGRALGGLILRRALMAARGLVLAARSGSLVYPVFVGRGVVVTSPRFLKLSRGVTIEDFCRLDCLGKHGIALGAGVTLRRGVHIEVTSVLRDLGEGCVIDQGAGVSEGAYIGAKGFVHIGAETLIGPGCKIIAEEHVYSDPSATIRSQGVRRQGINIGADCWLGTNAVVWTAVT